MASESSHRVAVTTGIFLLATAFLSWALPHFLDKPKQTQSSVRPQSSSGVGLPTTSTDPGPSSSGLTAKQIKDDIDGAKPFMQDQVRKNFEGQKVTWNVTLLSVDPENETPGVYRVMVSSELSKYEYYLVFFDAKLSAGDPLKIAKRDAKITVEGVLSEVDSMEAHLKDVNYIVH